MAKSESVAIGKPIVERARPRAAMGQIPAKVELRGVDPDHPQPAAE